MSAMKRQVVLGGDLATEDLLEEVAVGEILLAGVLEEGGQLLGEADEAEALQLLLDPLDLGGQRAHAVTSS